MGKSIRSKSKRAWRTLRRKTFVAETEKIHMKATKEVLARTTGVGAERLAADGSSETDGPSTLMGLGGALAAAKPVVREVAVVEESEAMDDAGAGDAAMDGSQEDAPKKKNPTLKKSKRPEGKKKRGGKKKMQRLYAR